MNFFFQTHSLIILKEKYSFNCVSLQWASILCVILYLKKSVTTSKLRQKRCLCRSFASIEYSKGLVNLPIKCQK